MYTLSKFYNYLLFHHPLSTLSSFNPITFNAGSFQWGKSSHNIRLNVFIFRLNFLKRATGRFLVGSPWTATSCPPGSIFITYNRPLHPLSNPFPGSLIRFLSLWICLFRILSQKRVSALHLLRGVGLSSPLWPCWIVRLSTFVYKFQCGHRFSFLCGMYLGAWYYHMVIPPFNIARPFPQWRHRFAFPPAMYCSSVLSRD